MAAPTKLYNLLQNRRGEQCSPLIFIFLRGYDYLSNIPPVQVSEVH